MIYNNFFYFVSIQPRNRETDFRFAARNLRTRWQQNENENRHSRSKYSQEPDWSKWWWRIIAKNGKKLLFIITTPFLSSVGAQIDVSVSFLYICKEKLHVVILLLEDFVQLHETVEQNLWISITIWTKSIMMNANYMLRLRHYLQSFHSDDIYV